MAQINIAHVAKAPSPEVLARLLCYGVQLPENLSPDYWARFGLDQRFIQGSVFLVNGMRPINTAVWAADTKNINAVPLVFQNNELWINSSGRPILCSPLEQPRSILDRFNGYGTVGEYLKYHTSDTIFASPIRECIFGAIGKGCRFCTFDMAKPKPLPPSVFTEMFLRVSENRPGLSLAIGPGTPNLRDHGVRYIEALIKDLSVHWRGPISVELVPPNNLDDLKRLVDVGVGSIIMSIEVWDDASRQELCPGKAYVSKQHYIDAWRTSIYLLGSGRASSVLLVGLEEIRSTKAGIDFLIEHEVVPTLIPFRPYDHIGLEKRDPVGHHTYMEVSRYNVESLKRRHIGPHNQVGCTRCGGCSLDIENVL
jgi:hypothetical protein